MTTTNKWNEWEQEAMSMDQRSLQRAIDGLRAELPVLDSQDLELGADRGGETRDQLGVYHRVYNERGPVTVDLGYVGSAERVGRIRKALEQWSGLEVTCAAASAHVLVRVDRGLTELEAYKLVASMLAGGL